MLRYCLLQKEKDVISDWFDQAREDPDMECAVAERHGMTVDQLNQLLRRVAQRIRDERRMKGAK
jgi:hypothetical protein